MRTVDKNRLCPVCGFLLDTPPFDFTICPSCGVEFGVDTIDHTPAELREVWLSNGPRWESAVDLQPKNWDPWAQLMRAGYVHFEMNFAQLNVAQGWMVIPSPALPMVQFR